jgi:hypothetical protein
VNSQVHITAIVPRLPPAIDGLGDYGLHLARQLYQDFGWITEFIVGDPGWSGNPTVEGFAIRTLKAHSAPALLDLLPQGETDAAITLLHYVGYGYARRGCPVWLVEGLERWRHDSKTNRLVTLFHELYAFGPIWTSAFWTSPVQRTLASRLAQLSDRLWTSKQGYAEKLHQLSQDKHSQIPATPVFSTVGEPNSPLPLAERPRRLIVFGGIGPRTRVYQRSHLALAHTCCSFSIAEIYDVGPALGFDIDWINDIPVTHLGIKTTAEISHLFSHAAIGFFDYPLEYLAKSTIFAAYCAHGMLPIAGIYKGRNRDGLEAGKHYLLADQHQESLDWLTGQAIADHAHTWYQTHCLRIQAQIFAAFLTNI